MYFYDFFKYKCFNCPSFDFIPEMFRTYQFQIPLLKFEQRKLIYNLEGTEHDIQKNCEEIKCIKMECKNNEEMVAKKSTSGLQIVELIMTKLQTNGHFFILPMKDITAMEALTKAFDLLLDIGKMDINFLLLIS